MFCKIRLGVYEQKITTLFVNRGGKSMFGKIVKTVEKVEFKIKFLRRDSCDSLQFSFFLFFHFPISQFTKISCLDL